MPEHLESMHPDQIFNWSEAEELRAYGLMLLIRRFEEKAAQLYAMGDIATLPPLSIGQEAVATGLALAALPTDLIVAGSSRPHGLMLARGLEPDRLMNALLMGGSSAALEERFAALHMRILVANQSPSPEVPTLLAAMAEQVVSECGRTHAAVWSIGEPSDAYLEALVNAFKVRAPLVFVIENASAATPQSGACNANPSALFQRCRQAGVTSVQANGLDVRVVKAVADVALQQARRGEGPTVLEVMTYRYQGHANPTGSPLRVASRRDETDPVAKARARIALIGAGVATDARLKNLEQNVRMIVTGALNDARGRVST
jgi:pyruvate dehydrogenase E1 component alpha subunit